MSPGPLRILIADDEALARQRLVRLLGGLTDVSLVAQCANGQEVLTFLGGATEKPDILLLDIRMPELSGLEARALLPEDGPYVIFTTAYSEHALEAFDVGADDYLLKPIEAGKLKRAIERARVRLMPARRSAGEAPVQRLAVQTAAGIVLLSSNELRYAELCGPLLTLHGTQGPLLADFSLQQLQDKVPAERFFRVHRRALVNLDYVERLEPLDSGGYVAHMRGGGQVTVSRQAGRRLRRELDLPG